MSHVLVAVLVMPWLVTLTITAIALLVFTTNKALDQLWELSDRIELYLRNRGRFLGTWFPSQRDI